MTFHVVTISLVTLKLRIEDCTLDKVYERSICLSIFELCNRIGHTCLWMFQWLTAVNRT